MFWLLIAIALADPEEEPPAPEPAAEAADDSLAATVSAELRLPAEDIVAGAPFSLILSMKNETAENQTVNVDASTVRVSVDGATAEPQWSTTTPPSMGPGGLAAVFGTMGLPEGEHTVALYFDHQGGLTADSKPAQEVSVTVKAAE